MAYYVYELRDPRDGAVFYVGKGMGDRIDQHEKEAITGRQSRKCDRIREIIAAGHQIDKCRVKHFSNEQEAYDCEAGLVASYGLANLTNVVPGGGTARGSIPLSKDREDITAIAELLNRTNGIHGVQFQIMGRTVTMEFAERRVEWIKKASEIAGRRGLEWVNGLSTRFGVAFSG